MSLDTEKTLKAKKFCNSDIQIIVDHLRHHLLNKTSNLSIIGWKITWAGKIKYQVNQVFAVRNHNRNSFINWKAHQKTLPLKKICLFFNIFIVLLSFERDVFHKKLQYQIRATSIYVHWNSKTLKLAVFE